MPSLPVVGVFGLGNPGAQYKNTRHNIGFQWLESVVDSLSSKASIPNWKEKYNSLHTHFEWCGKEVHLLKPQTFMNLSGKAFTKWSKAHMKVERVLVVYDDLDTGLGRLKLRKQGGAAGHNGLLSIFDSLGTQEVPRLKLGIGRPTPGVPGGDFVLQSFRPDEKEALKPVLEKAPEHLTRFVEAESVDKAMNQINAWKPPLEEK